VSYPRTYTQIHTPTVVQGGLMEPLPRVCDMLQYFECLQWKSFDLHSKMRYILWVVALLEACDVANNGRHLGCPLAFYKKLEFRLKPRQMEIFRA